MDPNPENSTRAQPTPDSEVALATSDPSDSPQSPDSVEAPASAEPNPVKADEDEQINRRRRGFVARLPKKLRDQVCQLILDGIPYKKIIESLGEAGSHISPGCITEWKQG